MVRLGPGADDDVLRAIEGVQAQRGPQRRQGHRQRDPAVQIVPLAAEDRVLALDHLDVEVAGRAAAGADLALSGQPDPALRPRLRPGSSRWWYAGGGLGPPRRRSGTGGQSPARWRRSADTDAMS